MSQRTSAHDAEIADQFTRQAELFASSPVLHSEAALGLLVDAGNPEPGDSTRHLTPVSPPASAGGAIAPCASKPQSRGEPPPSPHFFQQPLHSTSSWPLRTRIWQHIFENARIEVREHFEAILYVTALKRSLLQFSFLGPRASNPL
jgi:hypothetical protein